MINLRKIKTIIFFLLVPFSIISQNNYGKAYYKEVLKKSKKSNDDVAEMVKQLLKKQTNKEFVLVFNKSESLFEQEKILESPTGNFNFLSANSYNKLYQNLKTKKKIEENEVFGKIFLVKDDLNKKEWTITKYKKKIGKYNCTLAKIIEDNEGDINVISAWFSTELPFSHGPKGYNGLPGLILELDNNVTTIYCYEIHLNTKGKIKIPNRGEVVTQKKYDSILKIKIKELKQMKF